MVQHTPPDDADTEAGSDEALVDPASAFAAPEPATPDWPWPLRLAQVVVFVGAAAGAAGVVLALIFALADRGWPGAVLNMLFFGPGLLGSVITGAATARAVGRVWQRRIAQTLSPSTSTQLPAASAPTTSTSSPS